jgi:hypothetical protein
MTFITIYAAASAISAAILWAMCAFAPHGYQDHRGYHAGEPE